MTYVLPRSAEEYERLRQQALMWEPETAELLDAVGLGPGARCLDAGCGPGEVMRLMAERVGPTGQVTGLDVDTSLGSHALTALRDAGHEHCCFIAFDVESGDAIPGGPYDAVLARLLLLHARDPVAVLRRLWDAVAPGGHLVVQDHDVLTGEVVPPLAAVDEFYRVVRGAFEQGGSDLHLGLRLPALHTAAGIGAPDGIRAGTRVSPLSEVAAGYESVYRALLPSAIGFGLVTEAESEQWLREFAEIGPRAVDHTSLWPLLIGTWKRKS